MPENRLSIQSSVPLGWPVQEYQRKNHTLEAKHIVTVGRDLDGELRGLVLRPSGIIFSVLIELNAEVEA